MKAPKPSSEAEERAIRDIIGEVVDDVLSRESQTAEVQPEWVEPRRSGKSTADFPNVTPDPGLNVRSFQQTQQLGSGSYGQVYQGYDPRLGRTVVIKVMPKSRVPSRDVQNEVKILRYIKDFCQPYLLCYENFFEDARSWYIVTELLGTYVPLSKFVPSYPDDTMVIVQNLIDGLTLIHSLGIAHRDIKPDNIMIDVDTLNIKYIDFGLACYEDDCVTEKTFGTPMLMAPELSYQRPYPFSLRDRQLSDIWSLGMTIFEMLAKAPYFDLFQNTYVAPEFRKRLSPDLTRRVSTDYDLFVGITLMNELLGHQLPLPLKPFLKGENLFYVPLLSRMLNKNPARRSF